MQALDYIIVGQGLAGTLLAEELRLAEQRVGIIDAHHERAATKVAAGIANPITGRYFAKSWLMDELLPTAKAVYARFEALLGEEFFHAQRITRALRNVEAANNWQAKQQQESIQPYLAEKPDKTQLNATFEGAVAWMSAGRGGRCRIDKLIDSYRFFWQQEAQALKSERFDFGALELGEEGVNYKGWRAKGLIFAEGFQVIANPYFQYLPFSPAKGEVLIVRLPNYAFPEEIVKLGLFFVPLGEGLYWIGSNYQHQYPTEEPTEKGRAWLERGLKQQLRGNYELVEHRAAIRPTVKDRRPIIGQHPVHKNLYVFNGLGTKGTTLGPYFAQQLKSFLLAGTPLHAEADLARFEEKKEA